MQLINTTLLTLHLFTDDRSLPHDTKERNRKRKKGRKIKKALAKKQVKDNEKERLQEINDVAILCVKKQVENHVLKEEVGSLYKQLNVRKYATRNGFNSIKAHHERQKEMLASKLPTLMQLSPELLKVKRVPIASGCFGSVCVGELLNLKLDVAVKKSKGSSLEVEGRVYQALSGSKYFLQFFGMYDNAIVTELVQVYDKNLQVNVSCTLQYVLFGKQDKHLKWLEISAGIVINGDYKKKCTHPLTLI